MYPRIGLRFLSLIAGRGLVYFMFLKSVFLALKQKIDRGPTQSDNAKVRIADPEGIVMNCFPFTTYVIGAVTSRDPVLIFHRFFPVAASNAMKYPSSSPENTKPPDVDSVPPQGGW